MSGSETGSIITPNQLENGVPEESKQEATLVDWDGDCDPTNPRNWPKHKKWAHIIILSILALITNMAPTMCAPGIQDIAADLDITSSTISTLAITLYVLGIAIGPMIMSPLSEIYGRAPVYHAASVIFVAFIVGSALSQTAPQFMVFRFISGCAGGTPMALGGGTIADITTTQQRASSMALFSMGPLAGPVLGPLVGGFLTAGKGWRWTFWLLSILGGIFGSAALVIMRETHPKVILERKAAALRRATDNHKFQSKLARSLSPQQILLQVLIRPLMLLFQSPILFVISLYVALVFGVMYLLFTTFTSVFEGQYGFSASMSGLVYLGLGVSLVGSMAFFNIINGRMQAATPSCPENRLIPMIWFSPLVSLGLFVYGWTTYYKVHPIVPIIGTCFMGFGAFFVITPAQLYLIDVFGSQGAASALGANNLLRYASSTFLPLAGPSMYSALNYGWGNSLLGFIALAFIPAPLLFYKYGGLLRAKSAATHL
ncbi:major facilitator superfamily domain-containing protein [Aspergillus granulosus]|uniref:Major facilitator superfamily domain-containing protein n=1 Tax=Aspergillus granulosus TaxID=176169 RepID=A0ABR4HU56_9EURO